MPGRKSLCSLGSAHSTSTFDPWPLGQETPPHPGSHQTKLFICLCAFSFLIKVNLISRLRDGCFVHSGHGVWDSMWQSSKPNTEADSDPGDWHCGAVCEAVVMTQVAQPLWAGLGQDLQQHYATQSNRCRSAPGLPRKRLAGRLHVAAGTPGRRVLLAWSKSSFILTFTCVEKQQINDIHAHLVTTGPANSTYFKWLMVRLMQGNALLLTIDPQTTYLLGATCSRHQHSQAGNKPKWLLQILIAMLPLTMVPPGNHGPVVERTWQQEEAAFVVHMWTNRDSLYVACCT